MEDCHDEYHHMPLMQHHHKNKPPMCYPIVTAPPLQNPTISTKATNTTSTSSRLWLSVCAGCIVLIIGLLTVMGIVLTFTAPSTETFQFEVDSVSVYPFNISSSSNSHISANWSFLFSATDLKVCRHRHCHYRGINYQEIEVSVLFNEEKISSTVANSQLLENDKHVHERGIYASIDVSSMYIDASVAEEIKADWTSRGAVNFTVEVDALVVIEGRDEASKSLLRASCEQVQVRFSSNTTTAAAAGTMMGPSRTCITFPLADFK